MVTDAERLRLGRIAYLNVWPLYESLIPAFPAGPDLDYVSGHPSQLNTALLSGAIDAAPASAFAYLSNPGAFRLLPDLCIRAVTAPIQSVLLLSPVPLAELPESLVRKAAMADIARRFEAGDHSLNAKVWNLTCFAVWLRAARV